MFEHTGDLEVPHGAQRLNAVIAIGGNRHFAWQIMLQSPPVAHLAYLLHLLSIIPRASIAGLQGS